MQKQFIAGDWGTTSFRLYLCRYSEKGRIEVADSRRGEGVKLCKMDFESELFTLAGDWLQQLGNLPIILSGMIGSNIGWKETPYLTCPVSVSDIAHGSHRFKVRGTNVTILSGLRTVNPLAQEDILRGEELQWLGWQRLNASSKLESTIFALPGTHNKWLQTDSEQIQNFCTAFTGELYSILSEHSILIAQHENLDSQSFDLSFFDQGVKSLQEHGADKLLHLLFGTRAKQVLNKANAVESASFLSGLIIAADLIGASRIFDFEQSKLVIIADPALADLYQRTMQQIGFRALAYAPEQVALAGYDAVYQALADAGDSL